MHRLFVALRPPIDVRRQLVAAMDGIAGARWQGDAQLHATLRYVGEVDPMVAEDVASALDGVRAAPLAIAVEGVGTFDDGPRRAVWAGLSPREPLAALHRKIDHALVRAGLAPERRAYLPHITIARLGRAARPADGFLVANAGLASARFAVDHFLLYQSHLGADGATYEAIARYPLRD